MQISISLSSRKAASICDFICSVRAVHSSSIRCYSLALIRLIPSARDPQPIVLAADHQWLPNLTSTQCGSTFPSSARIRSSSTTRAGASVCEKSSIRISNPLEFLVEAALKKMQRISIPGRDQCSTWCYVCDIGAVHAALPSRVHLRRDLHQRRPRRSCPRALDDSAVPQPLDRAVPSPRAWLRDHP